MNAVCINLKSRGDRRTQMKKQARLAGFKISFLRVDKDIENPERGCRNSHWAIISNATTTQTLVLEDDAVFNKKLSTLPAFPKDWDIIYMGGTVKDSVSHNEHFDKATNVLSAHAYIVRNTLYAKLKEELQKTHLPVDVYYAQEIQPNYNCYILKEHLTRQRAGYSDIQNTNVDYTAIEKNVVYTMAEHTLGEDNHFILKTNDTPLPSVSIVTPTRNRHQFIDLMLHNFIHTEYPKHLLEWIIIDDSPETMKDLFPKDTDHKIKYVHLQTPHNNKNPLSISFKRNYGNKLASNEIIVHMDDDDIYDKYSVLARVRTLLYNKVQLVGSTLIECIDTRNKNSFRTGSETGTILEATMAYKKSYWANQPFNERVERGEGLLFLHNRDIQDICVIPGMFVITSLTHDHNITGDIRTVTNEINTILYDNLPEDVKEIIHKL